MDEHLDTILQGVLVYVEARVVVRVRHALRLVPGTQGEEGRRGGPLVARKVLAAHPRWHLLHCLVPEDLPRSLFDHAHDILVIHYGVGATPVLEGVGSSVRLGNSPDYALHLLGHQLPDLLGEGADCPYHLDLAWDDVVRRAARDLRHRDDQALPGVELSRD